MKHWAFLLDLSYVPLKQSLLLFVSRSGKSERVILLFFLLPDSADDTQTMSRCAVIGVVEQAEQVGKEEEALGW